MDIGCFCFVVHNLARCSDSLITVTFKFFYLELFFKPTKTATSVEFHGGHPTFTHMPGNHDYTFDE